MDFQSVMDETFVFFVLILFSENLPEITAGRYRQQKNQISEYLPAFGFLNKKYK